MTTQIVIHSLPQEIDWFDLLKWHLVKNNIKVNEFPTDENKADVGLIR